MSDDIQLTMLKTIVTSQEALKSEVVAIKESMVEIVRIEERQSNMTEGLNRIGRAVDKVDARMDIINIEISDLKSRMDRMGVKVGAIASIAATAITGIVMYAFNQITER